VNDDVEDYQLDNENRHIGQSLGDKEGCGTVHAVSLVLCNDGSATERGLYVRESHNDGIWNQLW
jgi:hypothetical protein